MCSFLKNKLRKPKKACSTYNRWTVTVQVMSLRKQDLTKPGELFLKTAFYPCCNFVVADQPASVSWWWWKLKLLSISQRRLLMGETKVFSCKVTNASDWKLIPSIHFHFSSSRSCVGAGVIGQKVVYILDRLLVFHRFNTGRQTLIPNLTNAWV